MPSHLNSSRQTHSIRSADSPNPALNFPEDHEFDRPLQRGSQGCVDKWKHIPSNTVIAVKIIRCRKRTPHEAVIHQNLPPHKSIIGYLGYYKDKPEPKRGSLILEYCPFGDLRDVHSWAVENNHSIFSEAFMWSVYDQLISALALLHRGIDAQYPRGRDGWRPIVHQDIKFENVLVKSLGSKPDWSRIELKLGDFGMATYYDPTNPNPHGYIGTTANWAPEITWETKRLTPASDVWAAASIIHELAHDFGPEVASDLTKDKWFLENDEPPYPNSWPENTKKSFWLAKAPRRVIPINLDPKEPVPILSEYGIGYDRGALHCRKHWPSPKYSDALNDCMMAGLKILPDERSESGKLMRQIESAHAESMFKDLWVEHDRAIALDRNDSDRKGKSL